MSFTIHSVVYDTLRPAPNLSNICIIFYFFTPHLAFIPAPIPAFVFCLSSVYPAYILCISCVYPACTRHPLRSTSSVKSYLRYNLTADYRTSPVPAIFHFFIHFYYFHLRMFERFMICIVSFHMVCLLQYTTSDAHPALIRHSSGTHPTFIRCSSDIYPFCILVSMSRVCPVYIRHSSGTHSFLSSSVQSYLRSNLTADSRTSPVPAILHFFIHSYYFHLRMFERFINCIVSFLLCVFYDTILMHAHPGLPSHRISRLCPACTRHPFLSIIFGLILPSV